MCIRQNPARKMRPTRQRPVAPKTSRQALFSCPGATNPLATPLATPAHAPPPSVACEYGYGRASAMGKDVFRRPAGEIEAHPIRQEPEARRRELFPSLTGQQGIELELQGMKMEHV